MSLPSSLDSSQGSSQGSSQYGSLPRSLPRSNSVSSVGRSDSDSSAISVDSSRNTDSFQSFQSFDDVVHNAERTGLTSEQKDSFFSTLYNQIDSDDQFAILTEDQAKKMVILLDIFVKSDPNKWSRDNQWTPESCVEYVDAIVNFIISADNPAIRKERQDQIDKIIEDMIYVSGIPIASAHTLEVNRARRAFMYLFGIGATFATLQLFAPGCMPFILEYAYCLVQATPNSVLASVITSSSSSGAAAAASSSGAAIISPYMIFTSVFRAINGSANLIKLGIINLNAITFNISAGSSVVATAGAGATASAGIGATASAGAGASAGIGAVANSIALDTCILAAELAAAASFIPITTGLTTFTLDAYERYDGTIAAIIANYFSVIAGGTWTATKYAAKGTWAATKLAANVARGAPAAARNVGAVVKTTVSVGQTAIIAVDEIGSALLSYSKNKIETSFLNSVMDMYGVTEHMHVECPGELPDFPIEREYANKQIRIALIEMYKYLEVKYSDADLRITMGFAFATMSKIDYSTPERISQTITEAAVAFGITPMPASSDEPMSDIFKDFMIFALHWALATHKMEPEMIMTESDPGTDHTYNDMIIKSKQIIGRTEILNRFLHMNQCIKGFTFGNFFRSKENKDLRFDLPHRTFVLNRLNTALDQTPLSRSTSDPTYRPSSGYACSSVFKDDKDFQDITYTPLPPNISTQYARLMKDVFENVFSLSNRQINTTITIVATVPNTTIVNIRLQNELMQRVVDISCNAAESVVGYSKEAHDDRLKMALAALVDPLTKLWYDYTHVAEAAVAASSSSSFSSSFAAAAPPPPPQGATAAAVASPLRRTLSHTALGEKSSTNTFLRSNSLNIPGMSGAEAVSKYTLGPGSLSRSHSLTRIAKRQADVKTNDDPMAVETGDAGVTTVADDTIVDGVTQLKEKMPRVVPGGGRKSTRNRRRRPTAKRRVNKKRKTRKGKKRRYTKKRR